MKRNIDLILLANWYLIKCKIEKPESQKIELARKYLFIKVKKVLSEMSISTVTV